MKLSVVIPHWPIAPELETYLSACCESLPPVDEIIIVVNDGIGFAAAVNRGLRIAHGDYIAVVSNDIVWKDGDINDLCIPGKVTSPLMNGERNRHNFWGTFFVLPREVYQKIGPLDERFTLAYYEDDDYIRRLQMEDIEIKCIESCHITSEGGRTMRLVDYNARHEANVRNKQLFEDKWKSV